MSETNLSASPETMRRLQIALIGLVSVIFVGTLVRVVVNQAEEQAQAEEIDAVTGEVLPHVEPQASPPENRDEPLAELGVTPAVEKKAQEEAELAEEQ